MRSYASPVFAVVNNKCGTAGFKFFSDFQILLIVHINRFKDYFPCFDFLAEVGFNYISRDAFNSKAGLAAVRGVEVNDFNLCGSLGADCFFERDFGKRSAKGFLRAAFEEKIFILKEFKCW